MSKVISLDKVTDYIKSGDVVMVGGFMANGSPLNIIDHLSKTDIKDLTLICNDTAMENVGVGKLVANKQFKKIIASHIGLNKETGRQMTENETEVVLVPQGTLVEQIRCAGYGLGGFLTATGVGTLVAQDKQHIEVDGVTYLLEKPLKADVALIYADKADKYGNLVYKGSMNNFNNMMASAAEITIVEAKEIVEVGELDPNFIHTPGIFVDYIVKGE